MVRVTVALLMVGAMMMRVLVALLICLLSAIALAWTHERGYEVANMVCWPLAVMAIITAAAWCCQ